MVQEAVNVDASGNAVDLSYPVPADNEGLYRVESHSSGGECGLEDLIAYSAPISVVVLPPDLSIARFEVPDLICPETVFTMSAVITNGSPGGTDQIFSLDLGTGSDGRVHLVVGDGSAGSFVHPEDALATSTQDPMGMSVGLDGNLYFADHNNGAIRMVVLP